MPAEMTRTEFFRSLIAGGATVRDTRGRKKVKHLDIRLYHGPMSIPPVVRSSPVGMVLSWSVDLPLCFHLRLVCNEGH